MSAVDAATQVDLSGYTVEIRKLTLTSSWTWTAQAPSGDGVPNVRPTFRLFASRGIAEKDALRAIEAHASNEFAVVALSGDELRNRVQGNNQ